MGKERYYALDALRGSMMLLGLLLHAAAFHALEMDAIDAQPSVLILTALGIIHQFRVPLFFLLSGFFSALLVEKYGVRGALGNRSKRILIPFLLCLLTVVPLTGWLFFSTFYSGMEDRFALLGSRTDLEQVRNEMRSHHQPAGLTLFHIWFLYYLLIYLLSVPALASGVRKLQCSGMLAQLRELAAHPCTALLLSLCTMLTLIPFRSATVAVSDSLFIPGTANLCYYGVFFVVGYLVFHTREFLHVCQRHSGTFGILALFTFVWYTIPATMIDSGSSAVAVLILAKLFSAVSTWCFIYFLCGFFLDNFNRDTPATRLLSQSAYWTYLLHMPVILFTGIVLMTLPVDMGTHQRLLINVMFTGAICYSSYVLLVRNTWLGELLNGRRYAADGKTPDAAALTAEKIQQGDASWTLRK